MTVLDFAAWGLGALGCYAVWGAAGALAARALGLPLQLWLLVTPLLLWLGGVLLTAAGPTVRRTLARLVVVTGVAAVLLIPALFQRIEDVQRREDVRR